MLEGLQWRTIKMKGLDHPPMRLIVLRLSSPEERRLYGISSMSINTWREGAKRIGPVSSRTKYQDKRQW